MEVFLVIEYVGISFILGSLGTSRQVGFLPVFIISLFFTPLAGAASLFNSEKKDNLQHQLNVIELLEKLSNR